ncbi:GIY-YIG nuclease family protein [Thermodesulfobacteriota bacterium]
MMFYVYAIISITDRIYIGQTGNLEVRLKQHNAGTVKSTKSDRPWTFLKTEEFSTREEARFFEWSLKRSMGKRKRWIGYAPEGR